MGSLLFSTLLLADSLAFIVFLGMQAKENIQKILLKLDDNKCLHRSRGKSYCCVLDQSIYILFRIYFCLFFIFFFLQYKLKKSKNLYEINNLSWSSVMGLNQRATKMKQITIFLIKQKCRFLYFPINFCRYLVQLSLEIYDAKLRIFFEVFLCS